MFLYQKIEGYKVKEITTGDDIIEMEEQFFEVGPKFTVFDTETTGLNYLKDVPFLFIFGFGKFIYYFDMFEDIAPLAIESVYKLMHKCQRVFAHNTKYDWHMMHNAGYEIPDTIKLADGYTIARLTNHADDSLSKSLQDMGKKYVDSTAKFAGDVIKKKLSVIKAERKKELQTKFVKEFPNESFRTIWEGYGKRVPYMRTQYDEYFDFIDNNYVEPNYMDVYYKHKNLMTSYACDDCVILLEWLNKALPVLNKVDPKLEVFYRECDLLVPVAKMERVGFPADIDYVFKSHELLKAYQDELYAELYELLGKEITVNQHQEIKKVFLERFSVALDKTDKQALRRVNGSDEANQATALILELRTVDKWLSTYVEGILKKVQDGRVYTKKGIDNAGAVSGRVSSDLQQQPKEAFIDRHGNELFHPRKVFLADDDYYLLSMDYSQQELRVQAYYTILTSGGDEKLLRAYMPFKCKSFITNEEFDYTNPRHLKDWNSGEWVDLITDEFWIPTDVHDETTITAFPYMNGDRNHPDFKHNRKLGKVCNFLKNYQGGINAIIDQLDVSEELAKTLDRAYYETFPKIKDFQTWVISELHKKGYVENLYGRRYYFQQSRWFYKAGNYLVQGSSADMLKDKQIKIYDLLKHTKSDMIMPVHDEILIRLHKDDTSIIPVLKSIMEDVPEVMYVPMVVDVEYSITNWAEMKGWFDES